MFSSSSSLAKRVCDSMLTLVTHDCSFSASFTFLLFWEVEVKLFTTLLCLDYCRW